MIDLLFFALAYLLGSVSTSIIVCKYHGLPDPRTVGSENAGATNVLRIASYKVAASVLIGDMLKGLIAVLIARFFVSSQFALGMVGFAAVLGHIFPVFFHFKGGKGVATAIGSILGLSVLLGLAVIVVWKLVFIIYRYSSLAAIVALASAPLFDVFLFDPNYFVPIVFMSIAVIVKHHSNIERLLNGEESKSTFTFKKKSD